MKKIGLSVILSVFIIIGGTRPAPATMVDVTQIMGKISDYIQKLSDTTQKISQQINQIKLMATQGFDLSQLRDIADEFIIPELKIQQKITQLVKASKKKKTEVAAANQNLYKKGAATNYETKKDVAAQDVSYLQGELAIAQANLSATIPECSQKYLDWDLEDVVWEKDRKWGVYVECKTRQDLYASQVEELSAAVQTMIGVQIDQGIKESRARNKDKNYKERQKHLETLANAAYKNDTAEGEGGETAKFLTTDAGGGAEWDTEGTAQKYQKKSEDYFKFARRYFYDPDDPRFCGDGWGKEKMVMFQSNTDRLNRERRYLYINSAAHLLQAASTARREIAKRMGGEDKIGGETAEAPNEYDAMSSYSATRIEHIKALLLYAQVQSAKLQYLAAKELLQAELRKSGIINDNGRFHLIDLSKYAM